MSQKQERFECPNCQITFDVITEPDQELRVLQDRYPKALTWLTQVRICPVCGKHLSKG